VSKTSRSSRDEPNQEEFNVLQRLVEDDTAAVHIFKTRSKNHHWFHDTSPISTQTGSRGDKVSCRSRNGVSFAL
jgi:hypothetical protein